MHEKARYQNRVSYLKKLANKGGFLFCHFLSVVQLKILQKNVIWKVLISAFLLSRSQKMQSIFLGEGFFDVWGRYLRTKSTTTLKHEYTPAVQDFFSFNTLYRWSHAQCMASFIEASDKRNNRLYKMLKLTPDNDQISIGNIWNCMHNGCLDW